MMTRLIYLFILLTMFSCRKDTETLSTNEIEVVQDIGDVNRIYTALGKEVESFSLSGENDATLFTSNGTQILIPANTFTLPGATEPYSGDYNVEVIVVTKKSDFLRLNKSVLYNESNLLMTKAAIYFNPITADQQQLEIGPNQSYTINFPNIETFGDNDLAIYTIPNESTEDNWTLSQQSTFEFSQANIFVATNATQWINCAYILEADFTQEVGINVELVDNYSPENTTVYILGDQLDAVIKLIYNSNTKTYTLPTEINLPLEEMVRIIAISNRTATIYHFGEKLETIKEENNWYINLDVVNIEEIDSRLSEL